MGNEYTPRSQPMEMQFTSNMSSSPFVHVTGCPLVVIDYMVQLNLPAGAETALEPAGSMHDILLTPYLYVICRNLASPLGGVIADLVLVSGYIGEAPGDEEKRFALVDGDSGFAYTCKWRYQRVKIKNWSANTLTGNVAVIFRSIPGGN